MTHAKWIKSCLAACLVALLATTASFAGEWAGKYMTEDTKGNAFAITLSDDGAAAGSKDGHSLSGTWEEEGDAAVITWTTGWTTKISKVGDGYKKTAYRPGAAMDDTTGSTAVEKVE
jgi:hypothetical protein